MSASASIFFGGRLKSVGFANHFEREVGPIDSDQRALRDDPLLRALLPAAPEVAEAFEGLKRAEAHLQRRRADAFVPRAFDRAVLRRVADAGREGVAVTPSMLAAEMHVTRPAMSHALRRLESRGFVTFELHPSDRRSRTITLATGSQHLAGDDAIAERVHGVVTRLTAEQREWLVELLDEIRSIVDEAPPSASLPS